MSASLNKRSAAASESAPRAEDVESSRGSGLPKRLSGRTSAGRHGLPGLLSRLTTRAWERDEDIHRRISAHDSTGAWVAFLALTFQSIGIVYGDIGTSFIYVFPAVFTEPPTEEDVVGVVSLVVWTITALALVKYALIVLRMDDNGQGGAFALFSLLKRQAEMGAGSASLDRTLTQYSLSPRTSLGTRLSGGTAAKRREHRRQAFIESPFVQRLLRVLVVAGVGAIMGDGVLTPSVSVVSACEGILIKWPEVSRGTIDGIAIAIIVVLFGIQQFGTGFVGLLFSPVVTLWLLANAAIGCYNIAVWSPSIFKALSPHQWFAFFLRNGQAGWRALGGVLLCVTGCEALFADLGHFSRGSIQASFVGLCWPCLLLTYLGQAAYLVRHPGSFGTSFWDALPHGTFFPMFFLATGAAIIASQALISAAFQIVKQAIAQGFFPRFTVVHTSKKHAGQIYLPFVCYLLGALCVVLIATFKTSLQLTKAYGLAVVIDMLLTTHFATLVMLCVWKLPIYVPLAFYSVFATVEATFLSATAEKIPTGGWFSLMMSGIYTAIMLLWFWGNRAKTRHFQRSATNLSKLLQVQPGEGPPSAAPAVPHPRLAVLGATPISRARGVALFYTDLLQGPPPALEALVTRLPLLHDVCVLLTVRFVPAPKVQDFERFLVKQLPLPGFFHVVARYGYAERVQQDEAFADRVLQRIQLLLFTSLQDAVAASPELAALVPTLPPIEDPRSSEESAGGSSDALLINPAPPAPADSAPDSAAGQELSPAAAEPPAAGAALARGASNPARVEFTSVQIIGGPSQRRSARAGASLRPHASAHGFTDASFQPVEPGGSSLEARAAAALVPWAAAVARGEARLPPAHEGVRALARELTVLAAAREAALAFVVGAPIARSRPGANLLRKYGLHEPYLFLLHNFTSYPHVAFQLPPDKLALVGLPYLLK